MTAAVAAAATAEWFRHGVSPKRSAQRVSTYDAYDIIVIIFFFYSYDTGRRILSRAYIRLFREYISSSPRSVFGGVFSFFRDINAVDPAGRIADRSRSVRCRSNSFWRCCSLWRRRRRISVTLRMSTLQARHRGHNIPDGVTTFNEIEYDREGGVFLNRTKLVLLAIIVFLLTAFAAFVGRYTAMRQFRQVLKSVDVPYLEYGFRVEKLKQVQSLWSYRLWIMYTDFNT